MSGCLVQDFLCMHTNIKIYSFLFHFKQTPKKMKSLWCTHSDYNSYIVILLKCNCIFQPTLHRSLFTVCIVHFSWLVLLLDYADKNTDELDAKKFLAEYNSSAEVVWNAYTEASWKYNTDINEANKKAMVRPSDSTDITLTLFKPHPSSIKCLGLLHLMWILCI